jgi:hypothetical protein
VSRYHTDEASPYRGGSRRPGRVFSRNAENLSRLEMARVNAILHYHRVHDFSHVAAWIAAALRYRPEAVAVPNLDDYRRPLRLASPGGDRH